MPFAVSRVWSLADASPRLWSRLDGQKLTSDSTGEIRMAGNAKFTNG